MRGMLRSRARPTFQARFNRMRAFPTKPLTEPQPAVELLAGLPQIAEQLHQALFAADGTDQAGCQEA
jgi:hypothetical protein